MYCLCFFSIFLVYVVCNIVAIIYICLYVFHVNLLPGLPVAIGEPDSQVSMSQNQEDAIADTFAIVILAYMTLSSVVCPFLVSYVLMLKVNGRNMDRVCDPEKVPLLSQAESE